MSTAILKGEVQTRIDALVYSSGTLQAAEVMQNSADAVGLDCDLTNITAVYNSMLLAVTSGTSADDLTALNVTGIALGITVKPARGNNSHIIGSLKTLHVDDVDGVHTAANGDTWLKTGAVETNVGLYPDAKRSFPAALQTGGVYTTGTFSTTALNINPQGITWDGTHFYIIENTNKRIYKYTAAGVYTNTSFFVGNQVTIAYDVTWDGTNFWVPGGNGSVFQYDSSGTYTGFSFVVSTQESSATGITFDGTNLWVIGTAADTAFEYALDGVYTSNNFLVSGQSTSPQGITWDGHYFYVCGSAGVWRYDKDGVYVGNTINTTTQGTSTVGIVFNGTNLWTVDAINDGAYEYSGYVPFVGGFYTGDSFSVSAQTTDPRLVLWDGTYIWVSRHNFVYKYQQDGTYISGTSMAGITAPLDATWDGTSFWVVHNSRAWEFDANFNLLAGNDFHLGASASFCWGLAWAGTEFLVANDTDIHRYSAAGSDLGVAFSIIADVPSNHYGMVYADGFLYIAAFTSGVGAFVFEYNVTTGLYTGNKFGIDDVGGGIETLVLDDTHFRVLGTNGVFSYTSFAPYVGIPTAEIDISTQLPIYLKVKGSS
jgi:hypothetical protein